MATRKRVTKPFGTCAAARPAYGGSYLGRHHYR